MSKSKKVSPAKAKKADALPPAPETAAKRKARQVAATEKAKDNR
jgi:hypothetical protein